MCPGNMVGSREDLPCQNVWAADKAPKLKVAACAAAEKQERACADAFQRDAGKLRAKVPDEVGWFWSPVGTDRDVAIESALRRRFYYACGILDFSIILCKI